MSFLQFGYSGFSNVPLGVVPAPRPQTQDQLLAMSMSLASSRQSPGSSSPAHQIQGGSQLCAPPPPPPPPPPAPPGLRLQQAAAGGPSTAGHMFPYGPALPAISESFFAEYARTFMPPPPSVVDPTMAANPFMTGPKCFPYESPMSSYPYFNGLAFDPTRRKNATRESTQTLKAWLSEHMKNPYPTKGEKIMLAIITKMTLTQVSTWFANARRRLKKDNRLTWSSSSRSSAAGDDDRDEDDVDNNDDDDDDDVIVGGGDSRRRHGNASSKAAHSDGYDSDDAADANLATSRPHPPPPPTDQYRLHVNGITSYSNNSSEQQSRHLCLDAAAEGRSTQQQQQHQQHQAGSIASNSYDSAQQRHQHQLSPLRFADTSFASVDSHRQQHTSDTTLSSSSNRHQHHTKPHHHHHQQQQQQPGLASPPLPHLASSTGPMSPDQLQRKPKIWSLADVATSGSDVTSRDVTMTSHAMTFARSEPVHSFIM